jgi:hypothetical protein
VIGAPIENILAPGKGKYNNNNNHNNTGTGDIGTINSNDRIAATMYSLGTWLVSGIYIYIYIYIYINTLQKGAKNDDNNNAAELKSSLTFTKHDKD